jgi:hypothetical protein
VSDVIGPPGNLGATLPGGVLRRTMVLAKASPFSDGRGLALRFEERPSRYVLARSNPDYGRLLDLIRGLEGREATYLVDCARPEILGIEPG